jgi:DNA-binding transcriptional ArsR family regulator
VSATLLSARDLRRVAARFKVLAEPARLRVLQCLQQGPQHVSALMDATGLRQANLSKHLQTLHAHGLVGRARTGRFIHYAIADPAVLALCDLMCRQMAATPALSRTASRPRGASPSRARPARAQPEAE